MRTLTLAGRGPNTMSVASLERLEAELEAAGDEPLLVTGAGAAFSAGLDLDALRDLDPEGVRRLLEAIERVTLRLFAHPAPTVAWVNGHAVAGGCLVAQACDLRIAAGDPKTRIGMTGVAIGLRYPPFVLAIFGHRLRSSALHEVVLGARRYSPDEALALGLVDEVVEPDHAAERARAVLEERSGLDRAAYAAAKRDLHRPVLEQAEALRATFADQAVPSWTRALRGPGS